MRRLFVLVSTMVTLIALSVSSSVTWLMFYQPRVPKSLLDK
ncbi:MAG: cyclic lactone autoinducer peptide [Clostridia bacterium]|nr:cyclic lactone autoinducer peptide [Clostridia bacterium]